VGGDGFLPAGIGKNLAFGGFTTEIISSWNLLANQIMSYE
jgi:hypothetical protein